MYSQTIAALEKFDNQHDFERMSADILNALGYKHVVPIAPRGGSDGGMDITFTTDDGEKGLACVTLRKDIDTKFKEDFSKRSAGEFDIYRLFCTAYLTASQKIQFTQYCRNTLHAEFIPQDIEALRSLLDSSLQNIRAAYLRTPLDPAEETSPLSVTDMQILWGLSGNLCAFPGCSNELIIRDTKLTPLGKMVHIIEGSNLGLREASKRNDEVRDAYENFVLFCPYHHATIQNDTGMWTPEKLREIKLSHETRMRVQRKKGSTYGPRFTTIHYLNIPRILMDFVATNDLPLEKLPLEGVRNFREMDIQQLLGTMQSFKKLISTWGVHEDHNINAFDIAQCEHITESDTGIRIHFDQQMITKNSPKIVSKTFVPRGNVQTDPHIYCSIGKRKVCFCIDPRWITTDTAFSVFMPWSGRTSRIAGLGIVKEVTDEYIIATPLVIGTIHPVNLADFADVMEREILL